MILDTTSKTIELILGSAKTTNDCEYTADYVDTASGTTFVPIGNLGLTNGTSAVTAISAPAGSVQRHVKALTVYNADTVNSVVTVRMYDGTNRRVIMKVTLTPGQTLCFTPEAGWNIMQSLVGQIPGTKTNDSAAAGNVGEYIESIILNTSEIPITTNTATNITSLLLTPGDWDVWGTIALDNGSGATVFSLMLGWISDVSATAPVAPNKGAYFRLPYSLTGNEVITPVGTCRFSVASNTTVYLSTFATFTNTAFAFGSIHARRVR